MHGIWTEKKSLGDNVAFFLGDNEFICIDVSKIPEIKANCITPTIAGQTTWLLSTAEANI